MNDDTIDSSSDTVAPSAESLARQLLALLPVLWESHAMQRRVIGIAGESGSGKSVTADTLARLSNAAGVRTTVINQDNYFVLPPRTNHENRCKDLANVGPHEVQMALIAEHVAAFRARRNGVEAPLVDYPGNRFVTQTYDFAEMELLIVEGTYVLQLPDLDTRIFLEATHVDTEERRRARNRDIDEPIVAQVLAIEHEIIAREAAVADVLIDATFNIVRG
jgi:uridine kinase